MKLFLLTTLFCAVSISAQTETPAPEAPAPPTSAEAKTKNSSIAGLIESCERLHQSMASLFGGTSDEKADTSFLSGINFPNAVEVTTLAQTRKITKTHQKIVAEWLKKYENRPDDKKFYQNEILVSEAGTEHWIIAREAVLTALSATKKGETVTLQLKILGFQRKKGVTDYFLLADGVK